MTFDLRFNYPTFPGLQDELGWHFQEMQKVLPIRHGIVSSPFGQDEELKELFYHEFMGDLNSCGFISNGANHSLLMVSMLLELANSYVIVDKLTYSGFIEISRLLKIRLVPCEVDLGGMIAEDLDRLCNTKKVKAIFVMGEVQNPYGWTIDTKRKRQIVEIARKYDLSIIDDGSFSFLSVEEQSFIRLAPERTFLVSSFSKSLDSRINLGLIYVPPAFEKAMHVVQRLNSFKPTGEILRFVAYCNKQGLLKDIFERKRQFSYQRQLIAKSSLGVFFPEIDLFASHFWIDLSEFDRPLQILDGLRESGILVLDSRLYSASNVSKNVNGFRISLGNGFEGRQLRRALDRIYNILSA